MNIRIIPLFLSLLAIMPTIKAQNSMSRTDSIKSALQYQQTHYPSSQYRDVYKNFMQDYFGPGHLLNDTAASGRYLRHELATTENFDGPDFEPTGFQGNFYRVNLKLISDGTIPYDTFFDTFVESVLGIIPPDPEVWMNTWKEIDGQISEIGWIFKNERKDREDLAGQFKEGNFIVHHSDAYNDSVNFHYRIISKDKFENIILPFINKKNGN